MKKVSKFSVTLLLVISLITSVFVFGSQAAESGTLTSNAIWLSDGVWHTKYWTNDNFDLNCYNKIVVPSQGYITFKAEKPFDSEGEIGEFYFYLFSSSGKVIWSCDTGEQKDTFSEYYSYRIGLKAGTYYMNLDPFFYVYRGSSISFKYKYTFTADACWEVEANNSKLDATEMQVNKTYYGIYGDESFKYSYEDYFKINLTKGKKYRMVLGNYSEIEATTAIMEVTDPRSNEVQTTEERDITLYEPKTTGNSAYWDFVAPSTGTYYIRLRNCGNKAGVKYSLTIKGSASQTLKKPTLCKPTNVSSGVKVNWKKVSGAKGYYIYRKVSGGSYKKIATVSGGTKVSYVDKTAKAGKTYRYTVKAYSGSITSSCDSTGVAIRRLKTPALVSVKKSGKSIVFKWKAVTGAKGYYVYKKTNGGAWKKVSTVSSSVTSIRSTSVKKGYTYAYTVKAYYGSSVSACNSKGLKIKY